MRKTRVVIADDFAALRSAMRAILDAAEDFEIIGEAVNGFDLLELLHKDGVRPDALILDLSMPVMTGIEALESIRRAGYDFKILVLTMHKEQDLLCRSFTGGVNGYMLKDGIAQELVPALRDILDGKTYLSPSMKTQMPGTCGILASAGQVLSSNFIHCK